MTTAVSIGEMLQHVLERLDRHEQRLEAIEAVAHPAPAPNPSRSSAETPAEIPWPSREIPPLVDRVVELEARLAEAEERVRLANHLETVGRLVAGVAHDFNNLLTVIVGGSEAVVDELPPGHAAREHAELVTSTARTATGLTRQLVAFCRPGKSAPCPVDANVAVRGVERTLRRLVGERVLLTFFAAPTVPLIRSDPGQFDQVLLNLVVNARDAIPADGTVTVRTAVVDVPPDRPGWPADVRPGEFVAVTVTDTGAGMSDEVKARVFDPFFSTKGDRGTGLGLSTVRDVVRAAGGHVEVESAVGWGTSVRVYWPACPEYDPKG